MLKPSIKIFLVVLLLTSLFLPLVASHEAEVTHTEVDGSVTEGSNAFTGDVTDSSEELVLPPNIQKLIDYENDQAKFYFKNLTFIVAFLAGIIGLFTPCSIAILPAFFAYSFKEKRELTKMTLSFFLGFMPVFVTFGLLATFFGKSIAMFQQGNTILVYVAGSLLIIFGVMALFGKGFSGIHINRKVNKTTTGIFLFGILFGFGFSACVGPILIGILLIAGTLQNYFYSGFLMFFYSLGLFVPLFLLAFFSDKYNFAKAMTKLNKKIGFSLTNIISGALLIIMGVVFLVFGGTLFLDDIGIGLGDLTVKIYSIQNQIIGTGAVNIIGGAVLIVFLYFLWRFLKKKNKKEESFKET